METDNLIKELFNLCKRCDLKGMKLLIPKLRNRGLDIKGIRDEYGNTLLHYAVRGRCMSLVEYLVQLGIDPKSTNVFCITPFHLSAKLGYKDILEYFILLGVDVNLRNDIGLTPL